MAEDCGGENPADYERCVHCTELELVIENLMGAREIADDGVCDVITSCGECGNINRYRSVASVELASAKAELLAERRSLVIQ